MSEDTVEAEGGSGKVFLVLGVLIGAGLGAGGGYYYFGSSADHETESQTAIEKKAPIEETIAIPFDRLAVPIYTKRGNKRRYVGNYFIELKVNVVGADNQIAVKRSMAELQHAFISAITKANLMREDAPTELDVDKAAKILKAKADAVIGAGTIKSVTVFKSMRISN